MKNLFVPYEIAKILEEKGFNFEDVDIIGFYSKDLGVTSFSALKKEDGYNPAPLYQQVIDWLRQKYSIEVTPVPAIRVEKGYFQFEITRSKPHIEDFKSGKDYFKTLDKAITEALKLI